MLLSVFELAQKAVGLWGSQNSVNQRKDLDSFFFVKNEASKDLFKEKIWSLFCVFGSLVCDMSTSSFL